MEYVSDGDGIDAFEAFKEADDNVIQNFQLDASSLRGRSVRLGSVIDEILAAHDYPAPVAHLVAETMTLAALLSSMLKYEGIFTLQTKGDGPVSMLVADVTSDGDLRGCASFDEERLDHARVQLEALKTSESSQNHLAQYLGKGYIAFTVDQGEHMERYQGIVELKGSSLVDCVQNYFNQSEQISTGIKMAVGKRENLWRAGGIMVQRIPEDDGNNERERSNYDEDDWRRTMIFLDSATEGELLAPDVHSNILLTCLFHEETPRVFEPKTLRKKCRCSEDKVRGVLAVLSEEDLEYMNKDGEINMVCEFCSKDYRFTFKEAQAIRKDGAKS